MCMALSSHRIVPHFLMRGYWDMPTTSLIRILRNVRRKFLNRVISRNNASSFLRKLPLLVEVDEFRLCLEISSIYLIVDDIIITTGFVGLISQFALALTCLKYLGGAVCCLIVCWILSAFSCFEKRLTRLILEQGLSVLKAASHITRFRSDFIFLKRRQLVFHISVWCLQNLFNLGSQIRLHCFIHVYWATVEPYFILSSRSRRTIMDEISALAFSYFFWSYLDFLILILVDFMWLSKFTRSAHVSVWWMRSRLALALSIWNCYTNVLFKVSSTAKVSLSTDGWWILLCIEQTLNFAEQVFSKSSWSDTLFKLSNGTEFSEFFKFSLP